MIFFSEGVLKTPEHGEALDLGVLTTFESLAHPATRPRVLALHSLTGVSALARAVAPAYTLTVFARMRRTLEMTVVEGIKTTVSMHLRILDEPDFAAGRLTTAFMDRLVAARPTSRGGSLAEAS